MNRRLTIYLFLAAFLTSCVLPITLQWGGRNTSQENPGSLAAGDSLPETSPNPPLQPATPTPLLSAGAASPAPAQAAPTATIPPMQVSGPASNEFRYTVQTGTPLGIANFLHPDLGCNWLGVGGQAFNLYAEPVKNLVVTAGGLFEGKKIEQIAVSGKSIGLGPGGFEISLGDRPVDSQGTVWIQLSDINGNSLSDQVFIDTFADCSRNLILINFTEVPNFRTSHFLPLIGEGRSYHYLPWVGNQRQVYYFPFVGQR